MVANPQLEEILMIKIQGMVDCTVRLLYLLVIVYVPSPVLEKSVLHDNKKDALLFCETSVSKHLCPLEKRKRNKKNEIKITLKK